MFLAELAKKGIKVKILRAKDDIFGHKREVAIEDIKTPEQRICYNKR
jgi:hypothetical protein